MANYTCCYEIKKTDNEEKIQKVTFVIRTQFTRFDIEFYINGNAASIVNEFTEQLNNWEEKQFLYFPRSDNLLSNTEYNLDNNTELSGQNDKCNLSFYCIYGGNGRTSCAYSLNLIDPEQIITKIQLLCDELENLR